MLLPRLPSIKERGGGGMIYAAAKTKLMETLKTPRVNQPPTEKLLHNNRVFAYNLNTARNKGRDPKATFFERKL